MSAANANADTNDGAKLLLALADLISTTVKEVISTYQAGGHDLPSLDSVKPGYFDIPGNTPLDLTKAIKVIEGACAQLCASIAPPGHTLLNKGLSCHECSSLQVVVNTKITDLLLDKPDGLHVSELATLSGMNSGKLGRLMRLLATKHVYTEVKPDVYANNRLSIKLQSSDSVSSAIGLATDEVFRGSVYIWDSLRDSEYANSVSPDKTAFRKAFGYDLYQYYAEDPEGRIKARRFSAAMTGWADIADKGRLEQAYPWSQLPQDTVICDLGGNNGYVMLDLMKTYPHLKTIVQDLETVHPLWTELWSKKHPEAVTQKRANFVPIDFFKESPVNGCDYYYIRHILHNWPDAECVTILRNVKEAMKPSSRVLIHEYVLESTSRAIGAVVGREIAPDPLLPNYGTGNVRPYSQDITMMSSLNAKERTVEELVSIGGQAGLTFIRLWDAGERPIVEFKL